jgi:hypothetical protein
LLIFPPSCKNKYIDNFPRINKLSKNWSIYVEDAVIAAEDMDNYFPSMSKLCVGEIVFGVYVAQI